MFFTMNRSSNTFWIKIYKKEDQVFISAVWGMWEVSAHQCSVFCNAAGRVRIASHLHGLFLEQSSLLIHLELGFLSTFRTFTQIFLPKGMMSMFAVIHSKVQLCPSLVKHQGNFPREVWYFQLGRLKQGLEQPAPTLKFALLDWDCQFAFTDCKTIFWLRKIIPRQVNYIFEKSA